MQAHPLLLVVDEGLAEEIEELYKKRAI